ncbi:MAG: tetratricopeptide repeat protein [Planctomycetes bacterium]|nr:tetratricopeptide repeat protein [Planctomycetota bacterium]
MYIQAYDQSSDKPETSLHRAKTCLEQAIERNPGSYRNFEKLTDVCTLIDPNTAVKPAQRAIRLYPGNARLRVKLGMLHERLGHTDRAREALRAALDIEDQFQGQFKTMYPDEPVIHRLKEAYFDAALAGLERLENKKVRK